MKEPFTLTPQEKDSAIWQKLRAHLEQRLDLYRKQNDFDSPESYTYILRGRIALTKELLGLDAPAITPTDRKAGGYE